MATVVEESVPPFHAGDTLSRQEFLRRWEAHPEIKNAELLGGVVYMASPVSVEHGEMDGDVGCWLGHYKAATLGTTFGHNATSFLLDETTQPDIHLRVLADYGGKSWLQDKYLQGVPEFLSEICRSSAAYDLHVKLPIYESAQVPEYLAILLYEHEIRWHVLVDGRYQFLLPGPDGLYRSRIFPGLWLDGAALLAHDTKQLLARLDDGLRSPEQKRFVAELAARKAARPPNC